MVLFDLEKGVGLDLVKEPENQYQSHLPIQDNQPMIPDITSQRTIESIQDASLSYKSIQSNNKSEYNRDLLDNYHKNRERMGTHFVQNLEQIDLKNDLNVTNTRNESIFNYIKYPPGGNLANFNSYIKLKSLQTPTQTIYSTVEQLNFQDKNDDTKRNDFSQNKKYSNTVEIPKFIEPKKFELRPTSQKPKHDLAQTAPGNSGFKKLKRSRSARQIFDDDDDFFSIRSPSDKKKKSAIRKIGRRSYNQRSGVLSNFMANNQHKNSNDLDRLQNLPEIPAFDISKTLSNIKHKYALLFSKQPQNFDFQWNIIHDVRM